MRTELITDLHPRFNQAQLIVAGKHVRRAGDGSYLVRSAENEYCVDLGGDATEDRCTCLWYTKYRGTRGPCKHVLAARGFAAETADPLQKAIRE